jgi:cyclase
MPAIKVFNLRDVDELILLDISATDEGRAPDYEELALLAAECFVPLTVGGGVNSPEIIRELLKAGADKVTINTAAFDTPDLIREASRRFGAQCIVASIDARRQGDGGWRCYSHAGSKETGQNPAEWAQQLESLGAGEIMLTSIERDGTMEGYDLDLISAVAAAVDIPVIASGGAGSVDDMIAAVQDSKASAVAAASIYQFTEVTPAEVKQSMAQANIPVRKDLRLQLQEEA